jgi:UDP-N-acetylmuramoylalanine--D-glutamate ligase
MNNLIIKKSDIEGKGIFTQKDIKNGDLFCKIPASKIFNYPAKACARVEENKWVCDEEVLNFVNHSCNPNSKIEKTSDGTFLLAIRDIKNGEEITVDYNITERGSEKVKCNCKDEKCKKNFNIFGKMDYFKNKKITVMGLGLLGRGLGDVKFLAECGADLIVTDLKTAEQLESSLSELKEFKNIKYTLGEHKLEDFRDRDFILKAAGVPLDSIYIAEARKNNVPIEMSSALFTKLADGVKIVGITGTRGKSTVTHLLFEIIKNSGAKVFLGGNVKGVATLPLIKEVKPNDIVVMELDSWQLQGFGEEKISPNVSIFTTFLPDHLNYYKGDMDKYFDDKANIFKYQSENDYLILGYQAESFLEKYKKDIKSKIIISGDKIPEGWGIKIPGEHNRYNISLAIEAVKTLGIGDEIIQETVENFKGVPGRLELIKNYKGIEIYNDTTSTTPDAAIAGLKAFEGKKINLIFGGADKNLDMSGVIKIIPQYVKMVALLPGTGTDKIREEVKKIKDIVVEDCQTLEESIEKTIKNSVDGDILLFSPGFASFGMFKNEFDRGEQFIKIISELK